MKQNKFLQGAGFIGLCVATYLNIFNENGMAQIWVYLLAIICLMTGGLVNYKLR